MLQQQALVAGQDMGVVVLYQAAHVHKQDLALQVELRVLGVKKGKVRQCRASLPLCKTGWSAITGLPLLPGVPSVPASKFTPHPPLHPGDAGQVCREVWDQELVTQPL